MRFLTTGLALGFAASGLVASAAYTPVALPTLNTDIRTYTDGSVYAPLFPSSSQTLGGVPFNFQQDANGNTAFGGESATPLSTTIPVGLAGVSSAYTLINMAWGQFGQDVGSVTFNGSLGNSYTVQLIDGYNVRDHYYGFYVNTTTAPYTTEAVWGINSPGNAHLDLQDFALPSIFASETLTSVVFTDNGGTAGVDGQPFIAGLTVSTASTPDGGSTMALLGMGISGLAFLRRQGNKH